MTTEIIKDNFSHDSAGGSTEDGSYGTLHEKRLFEATMGAGLGRDVLVGHLLVREPEADLLTVEDDGEEVARIQHGYAHSILIVFTDSPVTRQLLRENNVNGSISLEEDAELYPEVKPASIWLRKVRNGWDGDDNEFTGWRQVHIGEDAKSGADWFHALHNSKLLK